MAVSVNSVKTSETERRGKEPLKGVDGARFGKGRQDQPQARKEKDKCHNDQNDIGDDGIDRSSQFYTFFTHRYVSSCLYEGENT